MPVKCEMRDGKWRLIEVENKRIATNAAMTPLDGGGHDTEEACGRQARAVNAAIADRKKRLDEE